MVTDILHLLHDCDPDGAPSEPATPQQAPTYENPFDDPEGELDWSRLQQDEEPSSGSTAQQQHRDGPAQASPPEATPQDTSYVLCESAVLWEVLRCVPK